jgi:hypothetical protein
MNKIAVHAVNLAHRTDRKAHIQQQFADREEFELYVVPAIEHSRGAYGLWQTIRQIVQSEVEKKSEYFILCEDDHTFTEAYTLELLTDCIRQAQQLDADILSGGVSWFNSGMQVRDQLYWIDKFNGLQFTVFFKKFYESFFRADFGEHPVVDINISGITDNKFMIYPYISTQKEFGYSDVTSMNAKEGYVDSIFNASISRFEKMSKVRKYYFK